MVDMPTRKSIAAAQANEMIRLMGFDRDYQSLRLTTIRQTFECFSQMFGEMKSHTNQCDMTLFEAMMAVMADEARRAEMVNDMTPAEVELFAAALHATALEAVERGRRAA
ncbi:MAG: hypothetical protein ACK5SX_16615 [Sandaracinobacter sp.]